MDASLPSPLRRAAPLLALLALTAAVYALLWPAAFSWDDEALVRDNQLTGSLANLPELFRRDLWSTTRLSSLQSGYYRPLFLVSLALDRAAFGLSATAAHIHSLLWHLAAVTALYALLFRLLGDRRALLGGAIFALHPVQSEVLALVAARNDSMAAAGTLGALGLLVCEGPRDPRPSLGRLVGAGLLSLFALLSKESGVLAAAMLLALDLGRWGRPGRWVRYLPLGLAVGFWAGLRAWAGVGGALWPSADSWRIVLGRLPEISSIYAGLLVWPWPLTPARHIHYLPALSTLLPAAILAVLGLGLALSQRERRGLARGGLPLAGLAWAGLALAPTLAATLDKGLLGERYLYLPMAGLALLVSAAAPRVPGWLVPAFAVPCVALLALRLPQWKDSKTVWQAAQDAAPTGFTEAGLAWYLRHTGDLEASLPHFEAALAADPPYRDACELVVLAHLEARQSAEAARIGLWAMNERGCPPGEIANHTALALASSRRWDEAVATARSRTGGPSGLGIVVIAAAWARTGKLDAVTALAPRVPGPPPFAARVAQLLRLAGDNAVAAQVDAIPSPPEPVSPP